MIRERSSNGHRCHTNSRVGRAIVPTGSRIHYITIGYASMGSENPHSGGRTNAGESHVAVLRRMEGGLRVSLVGMAWRANADVSYIVFGVRRASSGKRDVVVLRTNSGVCNVARAAGGQMVGTTTMRRRDGGSDAGGEYVLLHI